MTARALAADVARELRELYERVDAEIAARNPRCELSGRCCDFPRSGHRLYATDIETALAVQARGGVVPPAASGLCPWWVDGRCTNREGRPLGCRLYFCDPSWKDEMTAAYERWHGELKALHARHALPYRYAEFTAALREEAT